MKTLNEYIRESILDTEEEIDLKWREAVKEFEKLKSGVLSLKKYKLWRDPNTGEVVTYHFDIVVPKLSKFMGIPTDGFAVNITDYGDDEHWYTIMQANCVEINGHHQNIKLPSDELETSPKTFIKKIYTPIFKDFVTFTRYVKDNFGKWK